MTENKQIVFSGHQPNFLPYMGVFYKMYMSDIFVLDDDVQYSTDGMHNCNYLKVGGEKRKITIPVKVSFGDKINEARIFYGSNWERKLIDTVLMNYSKCDHFREGLEIISFALTQHKEFLCDMNIELIKLIAQNFGFDCKLIVASKDVPTVEKNNARNIYQCTTVGGDIYYSGVGGKEYNDEEAYAKHGIKVVYSDYEPVVYRQRGKEFVQNLSVLDYIFNQGYEIPEVWKEHKREWKR